MPDQSEFQQGFQLSERAELVLKGLISLYISDGNPVGSRTLSRETDLALSPATIRNVMADLEEHGLIEAPHTSAGRIPTQRGYRFFINGLLNVAPLEAGAMDKVINKAANKATNKATNRATNKAMEKQARSEIEERILGVTDPKSILTGATEMLSQITSFAGIVSIPGKSRAHIRQIEFLRLSRQRVLAILITEDGQVQNKILSTHRQYNESELVEAANYFNACYGSRTLHGVRAELLAHMRQDRRSMHREMRTALSIARRFFDDDDLEDDRENVLVSGENNLLSIPDFGELEKLKQLFDTFKTKQVLFDLLQKSMFADGVNIFIGEESGYRMFRECSVIAAPYKVDNQKVGVLGVIGPTRMNYDEVISAVDITAKLLGSALSATARQH